MKDASQWVLHAFLSYLPHKEKEALLRFLPDKTKKELQTFPKVTTAISLDPFTFPTLLHEVHYSWFLPTLKSYTPKEGEFFLTALSPDQSKGLRKQEEILLSKIKITEIGKKFISFHLLQSLLGEENTLIPKEYLPDSELNILALLKKKNLVLLTNYLSLYDLAAELRQIVETKILKKIYSLLSEDQKNFIKTIMLQKEELQLPRLRLDRRELKQESLRSMLHMRGLTRLGIALSQEHPDLLWYVVHTLDIGRGTALIHASKKKNEGKAKKILQRQIVDLLPLIATP